MSHSHCHSTTTISTPLSSVASAASTPSPAERVEAEADADESAKPLLRNSNFVSLAHLSFHRLSLFTLVPSVGALLFVFVVGFGWDYADLLNYDWQCGRVLLPSVSRIINLPKERVVWHVGISLYAGIRPIFLLQSYFLNQRVAPTVSSRTAAIVRVAAFLCFACGFLELCFLVALTVVGERESGSLHVVLFVGFLSACGVHQLLGAVCSRFSASFARSRAIRFGLRVRVGLIVTLILLVPFILLCFVLYWQHCVRIAYEFFAMLEYVTVLAIYGSHLATVLELRHFHCHVVRVKRP